MSRSKEIFKKITETFVISEDKMNERRSICESCEHNKPRFGAKVCDLCNCFIHAKTAIASSYCPIRKW